MYKQVSALVIFTLLATSTTFANDACQGPWVTSSTELTALDSEKRSSEIQKIIHCAKQATTEAQDRLSSIYSLRFDQVLNDLIDERTALEKLSEDRKQTIGQLENDLVERIQERDDSLARLKAIETQLANTQISLSTLSTEREKLNSVIADTSLKIKNLENEITRLEKKKLDLDERIKSLEADDVTMAKAISDLKGELDEKSIALDKSEGKSKEQTEEINSLNVKLKALTELLTASKSLQAATENRLSEALGSLGKATSDLNDLKAQIAKFEHSNSQLNEKLTAVQAVNSQLLRNTSALEEQLTIANADINRMKAELDKLVNENSSLKAAKVDLEKQLKKIENEKSISDSNLNSLQAENNTLKAQVDALYAVRSEFFAKLKEKLKDQKSILIIGDRFIIQSEVLFDVGSPDLSLHGMSQIKEVAKLLKDVSISFPTGIKWVLQVNGHTDIQKIIPGGKFASNWELSSARALTVVKLLQSEGVAPEHLVAAGFGEYQPVDHGKTQESFAKNRRIELKLTDDGPYK